MNEHSLERANPTPSMNRREFLQATATVAAVATAMHAARPAIQGAEPVEPLIDTNVSLGQWPFRFESFAETAALVSKLRTQGVAQAWAGSFEALLHKDVSSVNERLADDCRRHGDGLLIPIGTLNPALPGWEEDLRRCVEIHKMPGLRLHPNYHGYKLSDPVFRRVLQLADERGLLLQIAVVMEDERTIHPLVNVPATDVAPLSELIKPLGRVRIQLLNAFRTLRGENVLNLAAGGVTFEIATLEAVNGIANLLEKLPLHRLCFGSHAPFFYFESARLKLKESELADVQRKAVCSGNATRLLDRP